MHYDKFIETYNIKNTYHPNPMKFSVSLEGKSREEVKKIFDDNQIVEKYDSAIYPTGTYIPKYRAVTYGFNFGAGFILYSV
jgi:hypothetical protein